MNEDLDCNERYKGKPHPLFSDLNRRKNAILSQAARRNSAKKSAASGKEVIK